MFRKFKICCIISILALAALSCKSKPQSQTVSTPYEAVQPDSITWAKWFDENRQFYMYTAQIIEPGCDNEQHHAVNDLLSLLYKGNEAQKNDWEMIQWRLDVFCKAESIEAQIDSLLNFPIEQGSHETIKKSDLALFMQHFRINFYLNKLLKAYEGTQTQDLLISEHNAWKEYYKTTVMNYYDAVLGDGFYYLKPAYWNDYKSIIADQRIESLARMYYDRFKFDYRLTEE